MQLSRIVAVDTLVIDPVVMLRRGRRLAGRLLRGYRRLTSGGRRPTDKPAVQRSPVRPQTMVYRLRWSDTGDLLLSGWVYLPGRDVDHDRSSLSIWAQSDDGLSIAADVRRGFDPEVDVVAADGDRSYAAGWFEAVFHADELSRTLPVGRIGTRRLNVTVRYVDEDQTWVGAFAARNEAGTLGAASSFGFADGLFIRTQWDPGADGLTMVAARRAVVASVSSGSAGVHLQVMAYGSFRPQRLRLAPKSDAPGPEFALEGHTAAGSGVDLSGVDLDWDRLAEAIAEQDSVFPLAVDSDGQVRHLHWTGVQAGAQTWSAQTPYVGLEARPDGRWRITGRECAVFTEIRLDPERGRLVVSGQLRTRRDIDAIELVGATGLRKAALVRDGDGSFRAELELVGSDRWGNTGLMLPSGVYQLQLVGDGSEAVRAEMSTGMLHELDQRQVGSRVGCRLRRGSGGTLEVVLEPPLTTSERSKRGQCVLRSQSRPIDERASDIIVFESYRGRFATCSPLAIMRRILELDLPYRCYWSVRDYSVPVPQSSTPVIIDSAEWWRLRAACRLFVTNGWAGHSFVKFPGQQVLQTFHGTPYKKLAADRTALRATGAAAARRESGKWDYLVVQSDYMAERMASAYLYDGPVLRTGYPRNDILSVPRGQEVRQSLRRRLGIADDQLCVLYAPTLRENRTDLVVDLDLDQLAAALHERAVLLVRGHYTMSHRSRKLASRTIDVTTFPSIEELYLASDVAITDYSSIMFDYTVGGKPLLFFVPDLAEYASAIRGVYFDLAEIAPGPLLTTTDEVIGALQSLSDIKDAYRDAYRTWQQRFNPWDDGHAADRVVAAVFDR